MLRYPLNKALKDRVCGRCQGTTKIKMQKGRKEVEMPCPCCTNGRGYATK